MQEAITLLEKAILKNNTSKYYIETIERSIIPCEAKGALLTGSCDLYRALCEASSPTAEYQQSSRSASRCSVQEGCTLLRRFAAISADLSPANGFIKPFAAAKFVIVYPSTVLTIPITRATKSVRRLLTNLITTQRTSPFTSKVGGLFSYSKSNYKEVTPCKKQEQLLPRKPKPRRRLSRKTQRQAP
jgi:hypothetical protein